MLLPSGKVPWMTVSKLKTGFNGRPTYGSLWIWKRPSVGYIVCNIFALEQVFQQIPSTSIPTPMTITSNASHHVQVNNDQNACYWQLDNLYQQAQKCPICWLKGHPTSEHIAYRCPDGFMATDDYIAFKSKLEFQRKTWFYMCFNCLCPHQPYNIFGHPLQTGNCAEHQEDVIKLLTYGIWFQEPVCQRVFEQLGLRLDYFQDMDQYIQWICQKQDILNSMYSIIFTNWF